ncbi:MAG: response regulator [Acidobacteriota bacterium]
MNLQRQSSWDLAVDLASQGRLDEARDAFLALAEEMPESPTVWRWLANVTPALETRVGFLEQALQLNPEDSSGREELYQALIRYGVAESQEQRLASAQRCFERAADVNPDDELALLWSVEVCDDPGRRVEILDRLLLLRPGDTSIAAALARDLVVVANGRDAAGDSEEAMELFERAHGLDPLNADALLFLGRDESVSVNRRIDMLESFLVQKPDHGEAEALWRDLTSRAMDESSTLPIVGCPICRTPIEPSAIECDGCGAYLSLFDVEKLLKNRRVVQELLIKNVNRLKEVVRGDRGNWQARRALLLAWLNLGDVRRAAREVERLLETIPLNEPDRLEVEQVKVYLLRTGVKDKTAVQPPPEEEPVEAQRILVVDDSATVRALVGATLETEGFEVDFAATGMEALAALRKHVPNLVLLDIGLPNMDGYQLCQLIRQNPATAEVPVVMLSARDGFYDQVRGRMVGCQDYVTKPFEPSDLIDRIRHLVPEDGDA